MEVRQRLAFVAGKRVVVAPSTRTVVIEGANHIDRMSFEDVAGRVGLYERLHAKRPQFYAKPLEAARRALDLTNEVRRELGEA